MLSAGQRMIDADLPLHVLALNSGSSSLKFGLYCARSSRIEILLSGEAESIGDEGSKFNAEDAGGNVLFSETGSIPSQREAVVRIGSLLSDAAMQPAAIGHRIVHGGPKLSNWTACRSLNPLSPARTGSEARRSHKANLFRRKIFFHESVTSHQKTKAPIATSVPTVSSIFITGNVELICG